MVIDDRKPLYSRKLTSEMIDLFLYILSPEGVVISGVRIEGCRGLRGSTVWRGVEDRGVPLYRGVWRIECIEGCGGLGCVEDRGVPLYRGVWRIEGFNCIEGCGGLRGSTV